MESSIQFLSKCWTPTTYLSSRFFYAYGNTPMEDFLQDFTLPKNVDVLFLGAGDIRHTLKTVAGLANRPKSTPLPESISFNLVDVDKDVLARDVVLLEIIRRIDVNRIEDVEFLWAVWFNMSLEESHYTRLHGILEEMLQESRIHSAFGNTEMKRARYWSRQYSGLGWMPHPWTKRSWVKVGGRWSNTSLNQILMNPQRS